MRFAKRLLFDLPTVISATLMLTCIAVRARAIWRVDYGIYSRSVATPDRFGFRTVTMQSSRQGVLLEVADFETSNRAEIGRFALAYALVPRWQHGSEPADNAKRIIGARSTLPPDWSWLERLGARYERRAAFSSQTLVVGATWWPLLIATSVLPVGRLYVTLRRVGGGVCVSDSACASRAATICKPRPSAARSAGRYRSESTRKPDRARSTRRPPAFATMPGHLQFRGPRTRARAVA